MGRFRDRPVVFRIGKMKREKKFDSPEGRKLAKEYLKLSEMLGWRTGQ